jgi:hypothetical protein
MAVVGADSPRSCDRRLGGSLRPKWLRRRRRTAWCRAKSVRVPDDKISTSCSRAREAGGPHGVSRSSTPVERAVSVSGSPCETRRRDARRFDQREHVPIGGYKSHRSRLIDPAEDRQRPRFVRRTARTAARRDLDQDGPRVVRTVRERSGLAPTRCSPSPSYRSSSRCRGRRAIELIATRVDIDEQVERSGLALQSSSRLAAGACRALAPPACTNANVTLLEAVLFMGAAAAAFRWAALAMLRGVDYCLVRLSDSHADKTIGPEPRVANHESLRRAADVTRGGTDDAARAGHD